MVGRKCYVGCESGGGGVHFKEAAATHLTSGVHAHVHVHVHGGRGRGRGYITVPRHPSHLISPPRPQCHTHACYVLPAGACVRVCVRVQSGASLCSVAPGAAACRWPHSSCLAAGSGPGRGAIPPQRTVSGGNSFDLGEWASCRRGMPAVRPRVPTCPACRRSGHGSPPALHAGGQATGPHLPCMPAGPSYSRR